MTYGLNLPEYPWEALAPYRATAAAHPDGPVDLSIGTPVDPTPQNIREALAAASDAPGYPTTHGTPALREAIARWYDRRRGCLLYTSPSPRDVEESRMPSSA